MGLLQIDFFRKVHKDIDNSSVIGGLYSAVAILIGLYLFYQEFLDYKTVKYKKMFEIDHLNGEIQVNIDILFLNSPCRVISLDIQDDSGFHQLDIKDTIIKKSIIDGIEVEENGKNIPNYRGSNLELQNILQSIDKNEQCRIVGYFFIPRSPGNFHFSYHDRSDIIDYIQNYRKEYFHNIMNLNHKIIYLSFGDATSIDDQFKKSYHNFDLFQHLKYGFNITQNEIEPYNGIEKSISGKNEYEYYCQLLPMNFFYHGKKMYYQLYQFSMNQLFLSKQADEITSVTFKYSVVPITIKHHKGERKKLYSFIVEVLAIIGGIFSVIGMLNSVTLGIIQLIKSNL